MTSVIGNGELFFLDLLFNLNLPFSFLKYKLLIVLGSLFKNL